MNKKTLIQLSLLLIVLIIVITIFFKYLYENNEVVKIETSKEKIADVPEKSANIIKDIEYLSKDNSGNTYLINAKIGEIDSKNSNIIFLKNVKAKISIIDSEDIYITSDFANYNSKNYDTNFFENIKIKYADHKIDCEYLDLLFNKNIAILNKNIVYKSLETNLLADRMEIDLITKNSKISMKNKKDKIEIVYKK
tara:strand:+ start:432 stop:1016 length:585 start_codon:yes stop_codon:yes gene_type:complete